MKNKITLNNLVNFIDLVIKHNVFSHVLPQANLTHKFDPVPTGRGLNYGIHSCFELLNYTFNNKKLIQSLSTQPNLPSKCLINFHRKFVKNASNCNVEIGKTINGKSQYVNIGIYEHVFIPTNNALAEKLILPNKQASLILPNNKFNYSYDDVQLFKQKILLYNGVKNKFEYNAFKFRIDVNLQLSNFKLFNIQDFSQLTISNGEI
jgi:hypothetical protein